MEENIDILYRRIRTRRKELGMSQEELALKVGYKTKSSINKIELGQNDISQSKINEFAKALNTTPTYLMGWDANVEKVPMDTDTITIKVYGSVPAGQPIEALEDIIGYEEIPTAWTRFGKEFIALVVKRRP